MSQFRGDIFLLYLETLGLGGHTLDDLEFGGLNLDTLNGSKETNQVRERDTNEDASVCYTYIILDNNSAIIYIGLIGLST